MTVTTTYSIVGGATTSVTANLVGVQSRATVLNYTPATSVVLFYDPLEGEIYARRIDNATGQPTGAINFIASDVAAALDAVGQPLSISAVMVGSNIALTWQTTGVPSDVRFAIWNPATSTIVASGVVDGSSNSVLHPEIALLDNGNFVIVYELAFSATDHDIWGRVYNSAGVPQTANFVIDQSGSYDSYPAVNALADPNADGGFIVGFTRTDLTTGNTSIYQGEYLANGVASVAPALVDANGAVNQGIQYATGSYETLAFWEDSSWSGLTTNTAVSVADVFNGGAPTQGTGSSGNDFVTDAETGVYTAMVYTNTFSATDLDARGVIYFSNGTILGNFVISQSSTADETGAQIAWINGGQFRVTYNTDVATAGDADGGVATQLFTITRTSNGDGDSDYIDFQNDDVNDVINGGGGLDEIFSGSGTDIVNGGDGNDLIETLGIATVNGDAGNDTIVVSGTATVNGGTGTDTVEARSVAVALDGGADNDTLRIYLLGASSGVSINLTNMWTGGTGSLGSGTVTSFERLSSVQATNFADIIVLGGVTYATSFVTVRGEGGDDIIIGGDNDDRINGGDGNDQLVGGSGFDLLIDDDSGTLIGGNGDDTYDVGSRNHSIVELLDEGFDTLISRVATYVLPNHVERLTFSGVTNVLGIGNGGDNEIIGVSGSRDDLYGQGGNDFLNDGGGANGFEDTMLGGAGDDVYRVGVRGSSTVELAGEGDDTVETDFSVYGLQANIENLVVLTDVAHAAFVGNELNNGITGGSGADGLYGREGNDVLSGGSGAANTLLGQEGDDIYIVTAAGDSVIEFAGQGIDTVQTNSLAGLSYTLTANVENLAFFGSGNFTGIGNDLNNTLQSSFGDDFLSGLDGDDVLSGLEGADTLLGGAGADLFAYFGGETGLDRILDFTSGTDQIFLSALGFAQTGTLQLVQSGTPVATTANSTFLYNVNNGILSYDADGNGAGVAVQLAQLNAGLTLAIGDFIFA